MVISKRDWDKFIWEMKEHDEKDEDMNDAAEDSSLVMCSNDKSWLKSKNSGHTFILN